MGFVFNLSCKISFLLLIMAMVGIDGVVGFKIFRVGGRHGWHIPESNDTNLYDNWASRKTFHVGDSLRFEYKNDSVMVVDKYGYYHCDTTKATSSFNDGNTLIKLQQPGFIYFISGSPDHCHMYGQRMAVHVMSPVAVSPESDKQAGPHPSPVGVPPESDALAPRHSGGSHLVAVAQVSSTLCLVFVTCLFLF